jgi:protein-disulfide isomerase
VSKSTRNTTTRERVSAQREAQRKRDRRRRMTMLTTLGVVATLGIGIGWWSINRGTAEEATEGLAPITAQADGSVVMARAGVTAPVLEVFEDFQCPMCKKLEETSGSTIKNLAAEGKAKVVFHPITIFAQDPMKSNSVRAGAASRCVPGGTPWMTYHDRLYAEQPSESQSGGFALNDLVKWGHDAGVTTPGFDQCVTSQQHAQVHQTYSDKVLSTMKIQGTPTLRLNGQTLDSSITFAPSALRETVLDAGK